MAWAENVAVEVVWKASFTFGFDLNLRRNTAISSLLWTELSAPKIKIQGFVNSSFWWGFRLMFPTAWRDLGLLAHLMVQVFYMKHSTVTCLFQDFYMKLRQCLQRSLRTTCLGMTHSHTGKSILRCQVFISSVCSTYLLWALTEFWYSSPDHRNTGGLWQIWQCDNFGTVT